MLGGEWWWCGLVVVVVIGLGDDESKVALWSAAAANGYVSNEILQNTLNVPPCRTQEPAQQYTNQ